MAQPFVKIIDNKLTLVGTVPQGNPRVVSILGKARMGKSTFLNAIVSHLDNKSYAPFKAQDCDDHCTRGIDFYHLPQHNLLLLDSQGLDYEDASHDPHLLLLLYILSDVIIFNDTRRLENGALKLMEPVCTFTNYLDIDTVIKPHLYFRIFDSDVKDAQKNLEKVLGSYPDQYQSIRNSIKHLFHKDIQLIKTEPLDRPAKMMLANNMYRELLSEPLGFRAAIQSVLTAANKATPKSVLNDISNIIGQINENQEISIEKLDVVKLQAENDIHKWIQENVSPSCYTDLSVDGTQATFEKNVEPRKNEKKRILTAFTKRFKDVEQNIRHPFYKDLDEKLGAPIAEAIEASYNKAQTAVAVDIFDARSNHTYSTVNSLNNSFTTIPESYWTDYLLPVNHLESAISTLFQPYKAEVLKWIEEVRSVLRETVESIKNEEAAEKKIADDIASTMLKDMPNWMVEYVWEEGFLTSQTVVYTNDKIMKIMQEKYVELFVKNLDNVILHRNLSFTMTDGKLHANKTIVDYSRDIRDYDLVKPLYEKFIQEVQFFVNDKASDVRDVVIQQKMDFLSGKLFASGGNFLNEKCAWTINLIKNNPEIEFVEDMILDEHLSEKSKFNIMTCETHTANYAQLYRKVFDHLIKKGYADENILDAYMQKSTEYQNLYRVVAVTGNRYEKNIKELFLRRLQKIFCQESLKGIVLPKIFDHTETDGKEEHIHSLFGGDDDW